MGGVTEVLKQEHAIIDAVMRRLEQALESHHLPGVLDCLRFFDEELALHRRKEEEALLPEIVRCRPDAEPVAAGVLEAHAEVRRRVETLRQAINEGNSRGILESGAALRYLLRSHLRREEEAVFPLAERVMKSESIARVEKGFAAVGTFGLPAATPGCRVATPARRRTARRHRVAS